MVTDAPVALRAVLDPAHGGRWTSLAGGGREWLWHRAGTRRRGAVPGDDFVDAGGLEECLPTVRGRPDHGDVWARPWQPAGDTQTVATPEFTLTRRLRERVGELLVDYVLDADPGYRFVWAAHALLDLSPAARLDAPAGTATRVFPESGPWLEGPWPAPAGLTLDRLGPDDGTAVGAILTDCPTVRVVDGPDRLTLHLDCAGQPRSTALWRNLRGWPQPGPYRSIGVEPMLGAVFDLATAGPGDAATVPAAGRVTWRLTIAAHRRGGTTA
ncbi:hypothetical protein [Virgisporangium aurantiacum]|uniref:hypothetical protein n=1 Tax=Virgisporangium aurantiacum TaxID=175570 RepID=UPI0019515ACB|nr:hypothetical protein [Virgisporangium aurantiacum]